MAITRPTVVTPWADAGDKTAPSGGLLSSGYPFTTPRYKVVRQVLNWILNWVMNAVRYLCLRGVAEWSADETYAVGDITRDSAGVLYQLVESAVVGTTVSSIKWKIMFSSPHTGTSYLDSPAHVFRDAARRQIAGFDHLGIPAGRLYTFDEKWDFGATTKTSPGSGSWYGPWNYGIFGVDGKVSPLVVSTAGDRSKYPTGVSAYVGLDSASAGGSAAVIEWDDTYPVLFFKKEAVVFEQTWSLNGSLIGGPESTKSLALGFGDGTVVATAGTNAFENDFPRGAGLYKKSGQANWWTFVRGVGVASGSTLTFDTGVVAIDDETHHLRIEVAGDDADAEAGVGRVSIYVDGVLKRTETADFEGEGLWPFARMSFAGAGDPHILCVGRAKITTRDRSGDGIY